VRPIVVLILVLSACAEDKAPEAELRAQLYCNQDWGNSPHRLLNNGLPRCDTPCASFSVLPHHDGCTLVEPTEVSGTACAGALTVTWKGWTGCCAPYGKDGAGNFMGVKFVECK
jgi:hypothetical protein